MSHTHKNPVSRSCLGQILLAKNWITASKLDHALRVADQTSQRLGEVLVSLKCVSEERVYEGLAYSLRLPYMTSAKIDAIDVAKEVLKIVTVEEAQRHDLVPLAIRWVDGKKRFFVATSEPRNFSFLDELGFRTNYKITCIVTSPKGIQKLISKLYRTSGAYLDQDYQSFLDIFSLGDRGKDLSDDAEKIEEVTEPFSLRRRD